MSETEDRLTSYLTERIDAMLERPSMWGDYESVEFQMLLALEVYAVVKHPDHSKDEIARLVQEPYDEVLRQEIGHAVRPVSKAFEDKEDADDETFVDLMKQVKTAVLRRLSEGEYKI